MTSSGRDKKGRFTQGNKHGRGRPPVEREERYYEIAMTACTYREWKAIVKRAVADAMRGNSAARTWLSNFLLGENFINAPGVDFPETISIALERAYGENDRDQRDSTTDNATGSDSSGGAT